METIDQTRTRTCDITVNGEADATAPTCSGDLTESQSIDNPDYVANKTEAPKLLSNGVTIVCPNVAVGDSFSIADNSYTKRSKDQITTANAATSCTTGISDMSELFQVGAGYNGTESFNTDISHWDTSTVTDMSFMFFDADGFNRTIGDWDTSSVTNGFYVS